ncbi:MAG TPA: TonB-dependent receptor plug domain-containing protein [Chitinispirillaceae bacterium]|jgi:outer membrane cobalamin receptor|nr:TonB-dependent receptor plug domain-containing protein [Chitinispirillaceae bacterium]
MITGLFILTSTAKDSTDLVELQPMTVTRQRIIEYDCLDSSLIYRASESNSIDGLLTNVAGIDVKRSSPFSGKGKSVTLRGFDESRFLILLDGRQLNGSGVMCVSDTEENPDL